MRWVEFNYECKFPTFCQSRTSGSTVSSLLHCKSSHTLRWTITTLMPISVYKTIFYKVNSSLCIDVCFFLTIRLEDAGAETEQNDLMSTVWNNHYLMWISVKLWQEHKAPANMTTPSMLTSLSVTLKNTHQHNEPAGRTSFAFDELPYLFRKWPQGKRSILSWHSTDSSNKDLFAERVLLLPTNQNRTALYRNSSLPLWIHDVLTEQP